MSFIQIAHAADTKAALSAITAPIITHIVNPILALLFACAGLVLIWGVAGMIIHGDDAEKRKQAQWHILYGVIGLFIMITAYGIIRLIAGTIGVDDPFTATGFGGFGI